MSSRLKTWLPHVVGTRCSDYIGLPVPGWQAAFLWCSLMSVSTNKWNREKTIKKQKWNWNETSCDSNAFPVFWAGPKNKICLRPWMHSLSPSSDKAVSPMFHGKHCQTGQTLQFLSSKQPKKHPWNTCFRCFLSSVTAALWVHEISDALADLLSDMSTTRALLRVSVGCWLVRAHPIVRSHCRKCVYMFCWLVRAHPIVRSHCSKCVYMFYIIYIFYFSRYIRACIARLYGMRINHAGCVKMYCLLNAFSMLYTQQQIKFWLPDTQSREAGGSFIPCLIYALYWCSSGSLVAEWNRVSSGHMVHRGVRIYADDVNLLAPSVTAFHHMLGIYVKTMLANTKCSSIRRKASWSWSTGPP